MSPWWERHPWAAMLPEVYSTPGLGVRPPGKPAGGWASCKLHPNPKTSI